MTVLQQPERHVPYHGGMSRGVAVFAIRYGNTADFYALPRKTSQW